MMKFKNDNNREYITYAFKEFLAKTRIKYETNTPSYYPKQNNITRQQDHYKKRQQYVAFSKFNFNIWVKAI